MAKLHYDYDPLTGNSIPIVVSDMPEARLCPPEPTAEERRAELAEEIADCLASPSVRDKVPGWYGDGWLEMAAGIARGHLSDLGGPLAVLRDALRDQIAADDELALVIWDAARDSMEDGDIGRNITEEVRQKVAEALADKERWEQEEKALAAAGY